MRNSVRKSISMILAATMILVGVTDNNVFAAKQKTVEKSLEEYKEVLIILQSIKSIQSI